MLFHVGNLDVRVFSFTLILQTLALHSMSQYVIGIFLFIPHPLNVSLAPSLLSRIFQIIMMSRNHIINMTRGLQRLKTRK